MPHLESGFKDKEGYLRRMSQALREKLRIAQYIDSKADRILDVGCADGTVTRGLARLFPKAFIKGIDLAEDFVDKAEHDEEEFDNPPSFEKVYLREILGRENERYDTILFTSVLHEFYTYGEGMSSVMKALADAYELLEPGGVIIIRDMILPESTKEDFAGAKSIAEKIRNVPEMKERLHDFEAHFGPIHHSVHATNHFLMKYFYTDNWERECPENYVPVSLEQYRHIAKDLGAYITEEQTYLLPFLRDKWRADFGLDEDELSRLNSTSIMVLQKPMTVEV